MAGRGRGRIVGSGGRPPGLATIFSVGLVVKVSLLSDSIVDRLQEQYQVPEQF